MVAPFVAEKSEATFRAITHGSSFHAPSAQPMESITRALNGVRRIIVVEQNHGAQLYHHLIGQKAIPPSAESVARPGPLPFRPSEIASYVA